MATNSSKKGARKERQLVNTLTRCGYAAMRCPSSGSATDRDLPDVIASTQHSEVYDSDLDARRPVAEVWTIELKATAGTTAYADASEIEDLQAFAEAAGAQAYLAARFDYDTTFYLVEPEFCRRTEAGNYGVPKADAEQRAAYLVDSGLGRVMVA